jgi:hypothetical protein
VGGSALARHARDAPGTADFGVVDGLEILDGLVQLSDWYRPESLDGRKSGSWRKNDGCRHFDSSTRSPVLYQIDCRENISDRIGIFVACISSVSASIVAVT